MLVLALAAPASVSAAERPFAGWSFWNKPLPANPKLAPDSAALSAELLRQRNVFGPWINTTQYSVPVIVAASNTPKVKVHLDTPSSMYTNASDAYKLSQQLASVPIPATARHAAGTDRHMVIWQPSTDTMWELWIAHKVPGELCEWGHNTKLGWHAAWGAKITGVSKHPGIVPAPFGATASGLPLAGGLMRTDEIGAVKIEHAIALGLPNVRKGAFSWPATRTDGRSDDPAAIPMGTRFRVDPSLDVSKLNVPPLTKAIALAAQRYGMVVRDGAGAVTMYAEDPDPTKVNPYAALFYYLTPEQILRGFPWDRLQALAPDPGYYKASATAAPAPAPAPAPASAPAVAPTTTAPAPAPTSTAPAPKRSTRRARVSSRRKLAARRRAALKRKRAAARRRAALRRKRR
jgi:hypothetical protein